MELIVLIVHLFLAIALVGVILLQKSEGGALGIGGGGGMGGFLTARGAANLLTRTTAILAGLFIITSLSLALIASSKRTAQPRSIVDSPGRSGPATPGPTAPTPATPAQPAQPATPDKK
ncbi:MAG TPA: preprotein translocase subunit SecG [Alphaproteobacteria bacterium]|jgi:preprotein translocase subunit SecG